MLHRKARPKRKSRLLKISNTITNNITCKGYFNNLFNKLSSLISSLLLDIKYTGIGKALLNSIPVLSIFVLLGIMGYTIISPSNLTGLISMGLTNTNGEVYAADNTGSTSSLIIDNGELKNDNTTTSGGGTVYSSHTVQVKADNITAYSLTINGPVGLTGNTTITGANNKTPANMANNTWGYAFAPNTTNNESTLSYQSFNGNNQTLNSSNPSVSNNSVDFTRKLVFAAKFSQDAVEGHYKANVKLNLTVTPKTVTTWDDITTMQDMTADICKNATTGVSKTLKDSRDTNSYNVKKLSDGNCWMTQNLKLDLDAVTLTATNSNVSSAYMKGTATKITTASNWKGSIPNSGLAEWTPQVTVNSAWPGDRNGYQTAYGYYYSWCAATANTCSAATEEGDDAPGSICPKGWQLPKGGLVVAKNTSSSQTGNDFANLMNADGANFASITSSTNKSWSDHLVAGPPAYFTLAGASWYRTGYVVSNGINQPGSIAYYWSRTIDSNADVYVLYMYSSGNLSPAQKSGNYNGNPVRCVAYSN